MGYETSTNASRPIRCNNIASSSKPNYSDHIEFDPNLYQRLIVSRAEKISTGNDRIDRLLKVSE